ncbi:DUF1648 domain-containing protein [bacterium]|nr:DUF1648 domain-containing protein [bacterium]
MWWILALVVLIQLQTGIVMLCLPRMGRRGFFFGKRTADTPQIARIRSQWRWSVILITLACMGATLIAGPTRALWWVSLSFVQGCGFLTAWAVMRARFKPVEPAPIDMNVRSAVLKRPPDPSRNLVRVLMWGPLAVIVVATVVLALNYNRIPERFPIHINARGVVDNWGNRDWKTLFRMPTMALLACLPMIGSWLAKPFAYMAPRRRFGFELVLAGIMWDIVLTLCTAHLLSPFIPIKALVAIIVLLATVGQFVIFLIFFVIWLKVSSRLDEEAPPTPAEINREDDRYWHWFFYNNPDDPALWVEKRFGVGATPNIAHLPVSLFLALGVLYVLLFVTWVVVFS